MIIKVSPTWMVCPTSLPNFVTTPETGAVNSAFTLSVSTTQISWPSLTKSPTLKCHSKMTPSCKPSPTSENLKSYI